MAKTEASSLSELYDLIVLGSGPAATRVATRCAKADWRVAVVDPFPVGGTCALHGCNPKKVLVRAAELVDRARALDGKGTHLGQAVIDWHDLVRFKRQFTDPVTESRSESYRELGIDIIRGEPNFTGTESIEVEGRALEARKFLIATGASPVKLPFGGAEHVTTSADFLELDELPKSVLFVGGGYISFEFAHVAVRSGAHVTIIERNRPLKAFDADLVDKLLEQSRTIGIDIRCDSSVESIRRDSDRLVVEFSQGGTKESTAFDLIVHGAGRAPNTDGLGLEQANVDCGESGVEVNEYFQSVSNPAVYAAGDVAHTRMPPLTPTANYQAWAVATNLLKGNIEKNGNPIIPSAVFSIPSLAKVGMTQREADELGIDYDLRQGDWSKFSSMRKVGATHAAYKILVDKQSDLILGAHLLGPEAGETINLLTLAIAKKITASELKRSLLVFPTFSDDVRSML